MRLGWNAALRRWRVSNRFAARGPISHILSRSRVSFLMLSFRKSGGEGGAMFAATSCEYFQRRRRSLLLWHCCAWTWLIKGRYKGVFCEFFFERRMGPGGIFVIFF